MMLLVYGGCTLISESFTCKRGATNERDVLVIVLINGGSFTPPGLWVNSCINDRKLEKY